MSTLIVNCFTAEGGPERTLLVNIDADKEFTTRHVMFENPGAVKTEGKIQWPDMRKPMAVDSSPIDIANMRPVYVTTSMFCGTGPQMAYCCEIIVADDKSRSYVINADTNEVIREPLATEYRGRLRNSQTRKCVLAYAYVRPARGGDQMETDEKQPGDLDIMVYPTPQKTVSLRDVLEGRAPASAEKFTGCAIRTRNKIQNV
jgi:hypothetical protein